MQLVLCPMLASQLFSSPPPPPPPPTSQGPSGHLFIRKLVYQQSITLLLVTEYSKGHRIKQNNSPGLLPSVEFGGWGYNQAWVLIKEISISVIIMLALCFTLRGGIYPFLNQSYVTRTAPSDSCCGQMLLPLTTKVVRLESMHATCFNKTCALMALR